MKLAAIALALELALPISVPANAGEIQRPRGANANSLTPFPMQVFCSQHPGECQAAPSTAAEWSDNLATLLGTVNHKVNSDIRPRSEPRGSWSINPAYGDCNDYALTKRSRLIKLGVPSGALRLAVTATPSGIPHTILVVKTSKGDVVLDNLSGDIRTVRRSGYSIHMISTGDPLRWTRG